MFATGFTAPTNIGFKPDVLNTDSEIALKTYIVAIFDIEIQNFVLLVGETDSLLIQETSTLLVGND